MQFTGHELDGFTLNEAAGERVLGEMSDELRRFHVVRAAMIDDMNGVKEPSFII